MTQAFISYASSDEDAARRLGNELEARGVRVAWLDRLVSPGESWAARLEQAILESDLFLVLVSPESEKSQWLTTETAFALSQMERGGHPLVVPVLLDRRARPSGLLARIQGLNFFDREQSSHQIDKLVGSVQSERQQPREPFSARDLDVELAQLKSAKLALDKEILLDQSRRAVWSSTIASAITVLAALGGILAAILGFVDLTNSAIGSFALSFGLGAFSSVVASLLFAFLRRRFMRRGHHEEAE